MEVKRVLGSERCYLMSDGRKIPFSERDRIFGKRGAIIQSQGPVIEKPTPGFVVEIKKRGRRKKEY